MPSWVVTVERSETAVYLVEGENEATAKQAFYNGDWTDLDCAVTTHLNVAGVELAEHTQWSDEARLGGWWTWFGHWADDGTLVLDHAVAGQHQETSEDTGEYEGGLFAESARGLTEVEAAQRIHAKYPEGHGVRPCDCPEDTCRGCCKTCGLDITWLGPTQMDWGHADV